jgi:Cytochrome P450
MTATEALTGAGAVAAGARAGAAGDPKRGPLPPSPRLPRVLQTAGFIVGGVPFLEAMRRRYGGAITMTTLFDDGFVMVFDPDLVKALFQGPPEGLHAGEANALLGPILGDRSVLLLDGAEHLRHRRLMLPSFHGRQLDAHIQTMRLCADEEIDRWPIGEPFTLLPAMQAITLNVILRAVFGYESGPQRDELAARVRSMIDPLARPRGMIALRAVLRGRNDARAAQDFEMRKRAVDELLYAEITRRRADPALAPGSELRADRDARRPRANPSTHPIDPRRPPPRAYPIPANHARAPWRGARRPGDRSSAGLKRALTLPLTYTLAAGEPAVKLKPKNPTALASSAISEGVQPPLIACRTPNRKGPAAAIR